MARQKCGLLSVCCCPYLCYVESVLLGAGPHDRSTAVVPSPFLVELFPLEVVVLLPWDTLLQFVLLPYRFGADGGSQSPLVIVSALSDAFSPCM
ncbi:hypothetical protein U1Q18_030518 [Sarracenia purpurea var. burkii]